MPSTALSTLSLAALLSAALANTPAAAAEPKGTRLTIDVHSEDGDGVHLTVGSGIVSGLVRAFAPHSIDCDQDRDDQPRVRKLFLALERGGDGARGTLDNGDELFEARRTDGKLFLRVTGDDGEITSLSMPWSLAACVLGGERISRGELARAMDSGDFEIHVVDGDDVVSIQFD